METEPMTREQSLVWASSHFLSTQFPLDLFDHADSDDVLEFIEDHAWQPFEYKPAQFVWDCIENLADDVRKVTNNYVGKR